jgi:pyrrolidone-carboxylate peptidase
MNWRVRARLLSDLVLSIFVISILVVVTMPSVAAASTANGGGAGCYDQNAQLTVEEQRLPVPVAAGQPAAGPELVSEAGFSPFVTAFGATLCNLPNEKAADAFLVAQGKALWAMAVARAQGALHIGTLNKYDDRALYWARLELTKDIRQWRPKFALDGATRATLVNDLDHAARGIDSIDFGAPSGTRLVMVSGFDPFELDGGNINRSNPAGAAALQLDGKVFDTPQGRIKVESVEFPVLWGAFDNGVVERAYGKALTGPRRLSLMITLSQGYPGEFTIERWAADWRGGEPDNNNLDESAAIPPAAGWPQPVGQFIQTTLPYQQMVAAQTGSYPVIYHQLFCVWPDPAKPGQGTEQCANSGDPAPGAAAASGGGGDYLSNESMYRANRLRIGLGLTALPGGHVHTPVLDNPAGVLTSPQFESARQSIVDQTVNIVQAAGEAVPNASARP